LPDFVECLLAMGWKMIGREEEFCCSLHDDNAIRARCTASCLERFIGKVEDGLSKNAGLEGV
jgi:hypothetical protein